jgi:hypothetical protein
MLPANRIAEDPSFRLNALFHRPKAPSSPSSPARLSRKSARNWKHAKLSELVKSIFFPGRFKRHYVESRPDAAPFLGGTNISQLLIRTDKYLSVTDDRLPELRVQKGWLLITRSGSTGIVATVPDAWDGFAISEHVIRVVPDPSKLPGEYLFAFLSSRLAQDTLARGVFGSVIDEISPEFVGNLDVPIPKSEDLLSRIVRLVAMGEEARQKAIASLTTAIEELDAAFSG